MTEPQIAASYGRAMDRCGRLVTVRRISGQAPRTAAISASVPAIVQSYSPDTDAVAKTGIGAREPGSLTQADRSVLILAEDLAARRFPLPVRKGDVIVLATGESLTVIEADAETRQLAGAIDIRAVGTS